MFSRRHPYLFFSLVFSAIFFSGIILLSLLFTVGARRDTIAGFGPNDGERVGVIEITGIISNPKRVISRLKQFREDERIKAIVLRIESPGGSVGPAQEIYQEVRKTAKTKKIVASMGSVAASGGYYIAAGASGIVANPGTITGSIGVILGYTNFQDILKKIGMVPIVVKSGEYKDMGSPTREMTAEEQALLQDMVDRIHKQFVAAIAESRQMELSKVESLADGRMFLGEEAKELGLVDRLGNMEDATEWAGRMAGIKGKIITVYAREEKFHLLKYIVDSSIDAIAQRILPQDLFEDF